MMRLPPFMNQGMPRQFPGKTPAFGASQGAPFQPGFQPQGNPFQQGLQPPGLPQSFPGQGVPFQQGGLPQGNPFQQGGFQPPGQMQPGFPPQPQQMPPQGMPPQTFNPMPFEGGLGNGFGYKKPAQNPGLGLGLGRGYFGPPQGMPTKGTRGMY